MNKKKSDLYTKMVKTISKFTKSKQLQTFVWYDTMEQFTAKELESLQSLVEPVLYYGDGKTKGQLDSQIENLFKSKWWIATDLKGNSTEHNNSNNFISLREAVENTKRLVKFESNQNSPSVYNTRFSSKVLLMVSYRNS